MGRWNDRPRPLSPILAYVFLACLCFGLLIYDSVRAETGTAVVENVVVAALLTILFGAVIDRLRRNRWGVGTLLLGFIGSALGTIHLFGLHGILRSEVVYLFWTLLVVVQIRAVGPDAEALTKEHGGVFLLNGLSMAGAGWLFAGSVGVVVGAILAVLGIWTVRNPAWSEREFQ